MNMRDLQAQTTRKKIYDIGVELLREKDFDDISISEICERADVSIGTFYYYFNSKRGILFEIYEKGDKYFKNDVKPLLNSDNSLSNIKTFLETYIEYVREDGVGMVKHLFVPENELFIKKNRGMHKILKEVIVEGQQKNQIRQDKTTDEIFRFVFVIIRGVVFDWCLNDGAYDLDNYAQDFIQYICEYLRRRN